MYFHFADSSDYNLRTTRILLTRYTTAQVLIDLRQDITALEGTENFQVQLKPESAIHLWPNEFLRDSVRVEIIDDTNRSEENVVTLQLAI